MNPAVTSSKEGVMNHPPMDQESQNAQTASMIKTSHLVFADESRYNTQLLNQHLQVERREDETDEMNGSMISPGESLLKGGKLK